MKPKLAVCNIFSDLDKLKDFALQHGFSGIDWSFGLDGLPSTPSEESRWVKRLSALEPLEVRYHCPFDRIDLGHHDPRQAKAAEAIFRRIIRMVAKAKGAYLTVHIGLGRNSTEPLSWEATTENLARVVRYGAEHRVRVCLENLAWGWTSRPHLFEKLVRRTGVGVTFDLGHAHACESVRSGQYAIEDFVTPHPRRVFNAHIYHTEAAGLGHLPPKTTKDIEQRLATLKHIGCRWWVVEIREVKALLQTRMIIDDYLRRSKFRAECGGKGLLANLRP